jgi:trk system potassium uptake protein
MRVVVAGGGNVGRHLGADLAARGHEVTVIDKGERALGMVVGEGITRLQGDACSPAVLERARTRDADVVVAATGDDEDNLVVSLLAKQEFAVPRVLARVNHPVNAWLFDASWGVDLAVSPPHLLTSLVEEAVSTGDAVPILTLERGAVELVELRLDERSRAVGMRVEDLELPTDLALLAVVRGSHVVPCRGTTPLDEGDEVIALVPRGRRADLVQHLVGDR